MKKLSLVTPSADAPAADSISSVPEILDELRRGNIVVLVDDEDRENEGDLVFAADFVSAEKINFLAKHGRGLICMPITPEHAARLELVPMSANNRSVHGTNFTVAIEAAEGVSTGISAADRAHTVRVASRPDAKASDVVQPGHVFPLVAQAGGVLVRAGHTEACCDLTRLAGLTPAAVLCEIMNDDGTMARLPDLLPFAQQHQLKVGTIADLIHYRASNESIIERIGQRRVRLPAGEFELVAYRDTPSGSAHLALVSGTIREENEILVRVHEPFSVLDFLDPESGAHSWSFDRAMEAIAAAEAGVLVLLNCAETDAGLLERFSSPNATDPSAGARASRTDLRSYGIGAQILRDLNVRTMRLLARPRKMPSMAGFGLQTVGYLER